MPRGEPVNVEGLAQLGGHIGLGSPEEGGQQGDKTQDLPEVLRLRHLKLRWGALLRHEISVYFGYANCLYNHRLDPVTKHRQRPPGRRCPRRLGTTWCMNAAHRQSVRS